MKIILDEKRLDELHRKLENRFNILVYLDRLGVEWAEKAIEPNKIYWTPEEYLKCYNNPQA